MRVMNTLFSRAAIALCLGVGLAACGGGGSDTPTDTGDTGDNTGTEGGGGTTTHNGAGPGADGVGSSNLPCRTVGDVVRGTDPDSRDDDWENNCWIARDAPDAAEPNLDFAQSSYTRGVQRIVWCMGYQNNQELAEFVDADFGPNSAMMVEDFQTDRALVGDGVVGPDTWSALRDTLDTTTVRVEGDRDAYALQSTDPFCAGIDAFYRYYDAQNDVRGWTMATRFSSEIDVQSLSGADDTLFGNIFVDPAAE